MSKVEKGILLDTHTWIWLLSGSQELSKTTVEKINRAGKCGKVFISAISVWELSILVAKNRITLSKPIDQWVDESFSQPGVNLTVLSPKLSAKKKYY